MRLTKWLSLILIWVVFSLSVAPVYAGTITVDTLEDGIGVAGCSLREAIARANAGSDGDGCTGVTGSPNTINLSVSGNYTLTTGSELAVNGTSSITIQESNGAQAVIQAAASVNTAAYQVFRVNSSTSALTLIGVTVRNGGNLSTSLTGGCIYVNGDLTLTDVLVENCRTSGNGGAIYGVNAGGSVTITDSTVQNNTAGGFGGGIFGSISSSLSVTNSLITGNLAGASSEGQGGGIYYALGLGTFNISGSTISNNQATGGANPRGGGMFAGPGNTGTISGTTFSGNSVSGGTTANQGGALYKMNGTTVQISTSIFTGNSVSGTSASGGVFYVAGGTLTVTSSRVQSNNSAATTDGDVLGISSSGGSASITGSCIVNNGDNAISDTDAATITTATGNWWGTDWGPRIVGAPALSGSSVSNGDSITGNGTSAVNVGLTDDGDYSTPPTGNWITVVPTIAGAVCMTCTEVSSVGHGRTCS